METIKRDGGWMAFEVQSAEKGLAVIAKTHDGKTCSHIDLAPADLAALGYVPEPVWRDAFTDPPEANKIIIGLLDATLFLLQRDNKGRWFNANSGSWLGRVPSLWADIPALPGKGE